MSACDHDGQLVELLVRGLLQCLACGEVCETVERHFGEADGA